MIGGYVRAGSNITKCSIWSSALNKPRRTFDLLSADLRNSPRQYIMLYTEISRDKRVLFVDLD
jgi:hypothetical protein